LRFKEFKGEWNSQKLSEICEKLSVGFVGTCEKFYTDEEKGVLLVRTGNLFDGQIRLNNVKYVEVEFHRKNKKSQIFPGDLLIARHGSSGQAVLVPNNFPEANCLNIVILRAKKIFDSYFLQNKFNSSVLQKQIEKKTAGSTQGVINTGELATLDITFPTHLEQQKIAAFLSAVDEKIQQLTRKKELLEQYKKGVMQQLFSPPSSSELGLSGLEDDRINADQTNPAIPKSKKSQFRQLRFKDPNGKPYPKWEEKLFDEIFTFYSTNSLSRDRMNYESGAVKNIHYGDIHTKFSTQFVVNEEMVPYVNSDVDLSKVKDENYCQEGDLVIADASEDYNDIGKSIELVKLNNEKVLAGLHTFLARPDKSKIQIGFSGYLVKAEYVRMQIKTIAQGTKVLSLSSGRVGKVKLQIPDKREQQKIASFLTALDAKIETVNNQIAQSQTFKKGLLQQMFV
jgi:type I restriction enzyme S subunit